MELGMVLVSDHCLPHDHDDKCDAVCRDNVISAAYPAFLAMNTYWPIEWLHSTSHLKWRYIDKNIYPFRSCGITFYHILADSDSTQCCVPLKQWTVSEFIIIFSIFHALTTECVSMLIRSSTCIARGARSSIFLLANIRQYSMATDEITNE